MKINKLWNPWNECFYAHKSLIEASFKTVNDGVYEADQTYTFDCPFHAATDEVRLENTGKNIKLAGSEDGCFYSTVQLKESSTIH